MATAKIATLAIRTLAKPIAAQIKHQAQSHQRFRALCISLAQYMHRTEMALRTNLLATTPKDGEKQKVRPLNEAKAVSNGANALAEGFLFALAAALIIGESYRGSRSRAKQRDRAEEGIEEMRLTIKTLAERVGVNYEEIQSKVREAEELQRRSDKQEGDDGAEDGDSSEGGQMSMAEVSYTQREAMKKERDRLQHAVNVLLRLALKSGWIQGPEALHLESILDGSDEHREAQRKEGRQAAAQTQTDAGQPSSVQASPTSSNHTASQQLTNDPSQSAILSRLNQLRSHVATAPSQ